MVFASIREHAEPWPEIPDILARILFAVLPLK